MDFFFIIPDSFSCSHAKLSGKASINSCSHWAKKVAENPTVRYVTIHFQDRRDAAPLCYGNHPEIIRRSQCRTKAFYPIWFACLGMSYQIRCRHSLSLRHPVIAKYIQLY